MQAVFYTTQGPSRVINQDGLYLNGSFLTAMKGPEERLFPDSYGLFAVADGLGGMGGGEQATEVILENLNIIADKKIINCYELERGLLEIQKKLHAAITEFPQMGATLAGLWSNSEQSLAFSCGDCRVYRYRGGELARLTRDHSAVQELFDRGEITEDEMRFHPLKNIVTSALSADEADPEIFCQKAEISQDDRILICSDGLWEGISQKEIQSIMHNSIKNAGKLLSEKIWAEKARDNVSFILLSSD